MSKKIWISHLITHSALLLPATFFALMSGMLFDAPGSRENQLNYFFLYSLWSYPLTAMFGIFIVLVFKKNKMISWIGFILPLISIGLIILSLILNHIFCDGQTACNPF